MNKMKKKLGLTLLLFIMSLSIYGNDNLSGKIFGVWNIGRVEDNEDDANVVTIGDSKYARTFEGLIIEKDETSTISYQGGYYTILDYKELDNQTIELSLTYKGQKKINEKWKESIINGIIRVHFIDDDHVWFEIVKCQKTDPDFTTADFKGKDRIYWRAKKIN